MAKIRHDDGSAKAVQIIVAYGLAAVIFGFDAVLQRDLLPVLYVVPVALTGFWTASSESSRVIAITGLCTVLAITSALFFSLGDGPQVTDRLLVLGAIWMTAVLSLLRKKQEELNLLRGMLPLCASCKKIQDKTGYWEQLESYLQKHLHVGYSHSFCPECAKQLLTLARKTTN